MPSNKDTGTYINTRNGRGENAEMRQNTMTARRAENLAAGSGISILSAALRFIGPPPAQGARHCTRRRAYSTCTPQIFRPVAETLNCSAALSIESKSQSSILSKQRAPRDTILLRTTYQVYYVSCYLV